MGKITRLTSLLSLLPLFITHYASAQAVVYEAENGILSGTTVDTAFAGYTGTGYVTGFDEGTDSVTITVTAASTALYDLNVTYQAPYGEKYTSLSLNGSPSGQIYFPASTAFGTVSGGQLLLNQGQNNVTFTNNWGWYLIDSISIAPSPAPAPHQVTGALNNPNASASAKKLMSYLLSQYGKHILSGQQGPASYAWVQANVGKSPAIIGLDMMDYSPSRVEYGTTSTAVEDAIAYDKNETMVNFCWHWNAPTGLINSDTYPWWSGFYTAATTFDLAAALADKTSANYALLIRDIDAIAAKLKLLQDANVPVVWRPLHEAEGGWFWWGRDKNPAPAKELYRIMYDRMTNYHALNNLIWVWNSVASDWYPGDDVVDILSYDSYPATTGDHGAVSTQYKQLIALGQDKKLVTLSEVGEIPDPDLLVAYHADWSYFVAWENDWISGGSHNSLDFLKKLYFHTYTFNWDNIKGWKGTTTSSTITSASSTSTSSTSSTTSTSSTRTSSSSSTRTSSTTRTSSSTSTSSTSTSRSSSTSSTRTSSSSAATATQTEWGQCGGTYYTGPTTCATGLTCVAVSPPWYYQCLRV